MSTAELDTDMQLEAHPLAAVFPMMRDDELDRLASDIRENGLREKIVLHELSVLDGRNRLAACRRADVEPEFIDWDGEGSALAFVVSRNLHRRHLDESQRGHVAARIAELSGTSRRKPTGQNSSLEEIGEESTDDSLGSIAPKPSEPISNEKAAELLNVSEGTVKRARKVVQKGSAELNAAVSSGEVSVADAAAIADRTPDVQEKAVAAKRSGKAKTAKAAADEIEPAPVKASKKTSKSGGKGAKPDLAKLYKAYDEQFGKALRSLDDIASAVGDDKFVKAVREGFSFAKTKMAELRRAHR